MANFNIRTTTRLESLEGAKILAWTEGVFPAGHVLPEDISGQVQTPIPVGMISLFGASTPPQDWLLCNGQAVSRDTYAGLYAVIGGTFGPGDGTTTFNLPNFGGRFPAGDNGVDFLMGNTGGEASVTLTASQIPAHGGHCTLLKPQGTGANSPAGNPQSFGGGLSHNNIPPFLCINFIIYAGSEGGS